MALTLSSALVAQDAVPMPSPNSETVHLSDLEPEVVSKIKAQHYAAQGKNIQQAYYRQLQENQQRVATQQTAFQQTAFQQQSFAQPRPQAQAQFQPPAQGGMNAQAAQAAFPRTDMSAPDAPFHPSPAQAPQSAYAAPQSFMPPVHIMPPTQRYTPGVSVHSLNGNHNAVQNFAPHAGRRQENPDAYRRPVRPVQLSEDMVQPQPAANPTTNVNEDTHVFLQDRIANALSRTFKRGPRDTNTESTVASETRPAREKMAESVMELDADIEPSRSMTAPAAEYEREIVFNDHPPAPVRTAITDSYPTEAHQLSDEPSYTEILESNQYASGISGDLNETEHRPSDHAMVMNSSPRVSSQRVSSPRIKARQRTNMRANHLEQEEEMFDISVGEDEQTIFDRYEQVRQTSAQLPSRPIRRRVRARQDRLARATRPQQYEIPTDNVSILLQEDERESFSQLDEMEESPFPDENPRRGGDRPKLRDDLEDANDDARDRNERRLRDRVRSRLDDDLDLEELDDPRPEEDDDEDLDFARPNREARKTCSEFQQELIAGSIREISLDISPPAAAQGAQFGAIARTWTDQRGNILATGALVDLRRGYVILDGGQKLAYARLSQADLSAISEFWRLPDVCVISNSGGSPYRNWTPQVVTWKASNLCHKPLFFENVQLERYGHSRGPFAQPVHSTLHFFVSLVSLPYQTAISPPNECEYALGYYRPGNCAPWLKDPIPISLQGIRREALFVTGAAFIP